MSGRGILSTDLYCFGLLSWRILLNGNSPFDLISFFTPLIQGSRAAKPDGHDYCFNEPTIVSYDSEGIKVLNLTEIQDLKSYKGDELLRLACYTTKTWSQWNSRAFVNLSTSDILRMFARIFSRSLHQNPLDRASSMRDILSMFNQQEKNPK